MVDNLMATLWSQSHWAGMDCNSDTDVSGSTKISLALLSTADHLVKTIIQHASS